MFKFYGWPRRYLSEWPVSLSLSFLCIQEPELCLWNAGILLSSPFHGPSLSRHRLWRAAKDSGHDGIPWSISIAVRVPNRVVFWEGNPAPVLNSSSTMNYWGSRRRLLVSVVSGTHSSDLWRCWLESWVPDFSLPSTFFKIKLFYFEREFHMQV